MVQLIQVWIAKPLTEVFETIRKDVASSMKKQYRLSEITVPRSLASQILAAQYNGHKTLNFKVRKTGLNRGVLEIV